MNKIEIGAVAKPQGIKGELKIRLFADSFDSVKNVTEVEINSVIYKVENFRAINADEALLKVAGIDERKLKIPLCIDLDLRSDGHCVGNSLELKVVKKSATSFNRIHLS